MDANDRKKEILFVNGTVCQSFVTPIAAQLCCIFDSSIQCSQVNAHTHGVRQTRMFNPKTVSQVENLSLSIKVT
jgi:hypothetical protein